MNASSFGNSFGKRDASTAATSKRKENAFTESTGFIYGGKNGVSSASKIISLKQEK